MSTTDRPILPQARLLDALRGVNVKAETTSSAPALDLVFFRIHARGFAIPVSDVFEILGPSQITPLPRLPRYLLGLLNRSGRVIPVLDIAIYAGFEPELRPKKFVVLSSGDLEAAVPASSVNSISSIEREGIQPPLPHLLERMPFVVGQLRVGDVVYSYLDVGHLLKLSSSGRVGE